MSFKGDDSHIIATSNMAALVDLRPKRELLNSNFDHYQLSLDSVPVYETALDDGE